MIHLTHHRRTLFACTALAVFLLLAGIVQQEFVLSASFGGGTDLLYQIQADLSEADKLDSTAAQIQLATQDILDAPTQVHLTPDEPQNNYRLSITLTAEDALHYDDYRALTNTLINSFTDLTFTPLLAVSNGSAAGARSYLGYAAGGVGTAAVVLLYILIRFRRLGSGCASAAVILSSVLNLAVLLGIYSLLAIPLDILSLLASAALLGFSVYDSIRVFDAITQSITSASPEDCARALEQGIAGRFRSLVISTLTPSVVLSALTILSYQKGVDAIISFSFPLTVGLCAALYFSAVLAPLIWYELKFRGAQPTGQKTE